MDWYNLILLKSESREGVEGGNTSSPNQSNCAITVYESKAKMNVGMYEEAQEYRRWKENKEWLKEQRQILENLYAKDWKNHVQETVRLYMEEEKQ